MSSPFHYFAFMKSLEFITSDINKKARKANHTQTTNELKVKLNK